MIRGAAAAGIEAFAAEADNLSVDDGPLLACPPVAGNDDDGRPVGGRTAEHVKACATHAGDLAIGDCPLLIRAAMAVKQAHGCAVGGVLLRDIDAFAIIGSDQLSRAASIRSKQRHYKQESK